MTRNSHFPNTFEVVTQLAGEYLAQPGRGPAWIDSLVSAFADVIRQCHTCADFYRGERYLRPADLLAAYIVRKDGLLDAVSSCFAQLRSAKPPLPAEAALQDLQFVMVSFAVELSSVCGFDPNWFYPSGGEGVIRALRACIENNDEETRAELSSETNGYIWNLAETAYRLSFREYAIVHEHRDWKVTALEWDQAKGPIDGRGISDAIYAALTEYEAEHPDPFANLRFALKGLNACSDSNPVAFVMQETKIGGRFSFAAAVKETLCLPLGIAYAYPPELVGPLGETDGCHVPSKFLENARFKFIWRFRKFLLDRAEAVGRNSAARRMWYEAAAEFLSKVEWGQPVFTPAEADRIIALANAAQREYWIERRLKEHGGASEAEAMALDPASEARPRGTASEPRVDGKRLEEKLEEMKDEIVERLSAREGRHPGRPKDPQNAGRNPRRGSGNHGTRTEKMAQQMSDFKAYLLDKNISKARTIGYWASNFWKRPGSDCEAAAKEKGEERGYAAPVQLASAYRSWLRAEKDRELKKAGTKAGTKPKKGREKSQN